MRMRAVAMNEYGGPEVLGVMELELPPLGDDTVRFAVDAAAVNRADVEIRSGRWPVDNPRPFPYVPGIEAAGRVVAVGPSVAEFAVGDIVVTMMQGMAGVFGRRNGGYAEVVDAPAAAVARVPDGVDAVTISATGLAAVTALRAIRRAGSPVSKTVLVQGGSGGVGSMAVALLAAAGAETWAVVRNPAKREYVEGLGAAKVVVAEADDLPAAAFDLVVETTGQATFGASVPALKHTGTLVLVGAVTGAALPLVAWDLLAGRTLTGYSTENLTGADLRDDIRDLGQLLASGLSLPSITTYPLADASRAHRDMETGRLSGRAVLLPA